MIKKSISLFLCIVMCISFFSMTVTDTLAAYDVQKLFTVRSEAIQGDKLKYSISLTKGQQSIGGIILVVKFDNKVLKPIEGECVPAKKGNVANFYGTFEKGVSEVDKNSYVIGYMNSQSFTPEDDALAFFDLSFKVIDKSRPKTDVKFYCKEYYSLSEPDKNITVEDDIEFNLIDEFKVSTLAKPVLEGVVHGEKGLVVSWKPVEGALGYRISRHSAGSSWESIGEIGAEATSYLDTNVTSGTVYTYTVEAFNNHGLSLYDPVGVTSKYIEKPVIMDVSNADGGIEIKWNKINGADSYIVLRRGEGEKYWKEIARRTHTAGTSYKDTDVTDGVTYEYDVNSAIDTYITQNAENGSKITCISIPEFESISNTVKGIKIVWTPREDATHYVVYRKVIGKDADFIQHSTTSKNSFEDNNSDIIAGKTYSYAVQVCTNNGDSAYSTKGLSITRVPPTKITSLSMEKHGVKVVWESVADVTGYVIYRRNASEEKWSEIKTVNSDVTSYVDKTAGSGGKYVYAVCPKVSDSEGAKEESSSIYFIKSPSGIVAENVLEGIKVTWERSLGATEYEIVRTDTEGKQDFVERISATGKCEFVDTRVEMSAVYNYTVKAISNKGDSLVSDSVSLMRIGAMGKATPKIAKNGIKITWKSEKTAEGYALFRSSGGEWLQITSVTGCEYTDKNVKSGTTYSYAVAIIIGESNGILNTADAVKLKYIAPPEKITATNGVDFIKLTWSKSEGATGYKVYLIEDGSHRLLATVDSNTLNYTFKKVASGKTYKFVIKAFHSKETSEESKVLTNIFLGRPQITKVTNEYKGVKVTWKAVSGAKKYYIYSKVKDGKWSCIGTVGSKTLSYTHTGVANGKTVYYAVKAVNQDYVSAFESRSIKHIASPKVTLTNKRNGVQVKWAKNAEAKNYKVYRKAGKAKAWTLIATVKTAEYTDTKVKNAVDYKYAVQACNGKNTSGYNTTGWSIRFLNAPEVKSVTNGYGFIKVSWNKVAGAKGYKVYRRYTSGDKWTCVGETTALSYKDKTVQNKSSYTYTVKAYYGSKTSGYYSGKSVKYLTAPKVNVENRIEGVQLNWEKVSGASSYYIYRKAGNATAWKKIATVSKNIYVDTKVTSGTSYTYMVRAYGSKTTSGYNTAGWKIVFLSTPKLVSANSAKAGITVKWKPVKKASGYFIFRKTGSGLWEQVGKVTGNGKVQYCDKTAKNGYKYTYTVRAYYGKYRSWFNSGITCVDKY